MPNEKDEPFLFPDDGDAEEISPEFIIGDATQVGSPAPAPAPQAKAKADPGAKARPRAAAPRKEPAPAAPPAAAPASPAPPAALEPAPAPVAASPAPVTPARAASPRPAFPLLPALLFLTFGFGAGFFAGRLWERQGTAPPPPPPAAAKAPEEPAAPSEPPRAEEPRRTTKGVKGTKPARAVRAATPAAAPSAGKGRLDLTAPADAEAFLDGKRIGKGSLRVDVTPGKHKIEVRLGKARVGERFEVGPNETWTYEVTPK